MANTASSARRRIYRFDEFEAAEAAFGSRDDVLRELGGKGARLAEMTRLGMPVPPGFVIPAGVCRDFLAAGVDARLDPAVWEDVEAQLRGLEDVTGRRFGDTASPLLLSCRSGSRDSMPGMMDTILDLGITDAVCERSRDERERRFAWDANRRLVQMFGHVVLGVPQASFDAALHAARERAGVATDGELPSSELRGLVGEFRELVEGHTKRPFPTDPRMQLRMAIEAVLRSWSGRRAHDYREAAGIPHDLGTAVTIMAMVFGNRDERSGTGVFTTRSVTTGKNELEGDFLFGAQGEDVVSGARATLPLQALGDRLPQVFEELERSGQRLEEHYRDAQDIEFTVESGTLWLLQTRTAKRTAQAAIRIAVDLAWERRITRQEALLRVRPEHVDYFLHPQFDHDARSAAVSAGRLLTTGLGVSPGAGIGQAVFDADTAARWHQDGRSVVLVRAETRPEDVHGFLVAAGIVTSRGGRTSHAALVARQFGKPAVVGAVGLEIDEANRALHVAGGATVKEGDWLALDGGTGEVIIGELPTIRSEAGDMHLEQLLDWADAERQIGVRANVDDPAEARRARKLGAEGIGLCRTEHMFFAPNRLPLVKQALLAEDEAARRRTLDELLPLQREDFAGLFRAMDGLPVTIRLIDPPLHEFLPDHEELREHNPMLGTRGVRLALRMPDLVQMQVRAVFEAACDCREHNVLAYPHLMVPLTSSSAELRLERAAIEEVAATVLQERGCRVEYSIGTMIEVPRAALVANRLAEYADFFSFGTNDLTQTTYGISRDDAEQGFLADYLRAGVLQWNPFATLDQDGVGELMRVACERGRSARAGLECGVCGEHGGDPASIAFCMEIGLDYVSCSPFRLPVARLAAAHAALRAPTEQME